MSLTMKMYKITLKATKIRKPRDFEEWASTPTNALIAAVVKFYEDTGQTPHLVRMQGKQDPSNRSYGPTRILE
jgi:hypothetical protein